MITITEIRIYPQNNEGNKVIESEPMTGGFNELFPMFNQYKNYLSKIKHSHIYRLNYKGKTWYVFDLRKDELKQAQKLIPNLN